MFGNIQIDIAAIIGGLVAIGGFLRQIYKDIKAGRAKEDERFAKVDAIASNLSSVKSTVETNSNTLDNVTQGLRQTQRWYLQKALIKAIQREWTNQEEFDEITKMYESYRRLGGNGTIKALYEKFLSIEIKEEVLHD